MISISTDWIGSLAAILTTVSFVPQAWRTWRTRDVSGISLTMYAVFTVGVGLWLIYGFLLGEMPLIAANAITFTLALLILAMRIRYGGRE
jgi:MtN3 and saliva related transmembrane protein